ncbi:MAG TPA: nuclear transport factor 2 family protein [Mycobacteriales bacterium]|jgi:hypothetical protein|nr:nuclear transport factor 2 family protein [Mycobacteriales bacterium]
MSRAAAVAAYGQAWREPDAEARRRLLEQAWAEGGVYCDPQVLLTGRAALVEHIGGFQASAPGWEIAVTSEPLEHHDAAYFTWTLCDADGAVAVTGIDVALFGADGRIERLTGFFTG